MGPCLPLGAAGFARAARRPRRFAFRAGRAPPSARAAVAEQQEQSKMSIDLVPLCLDPARLFVPGLTMLQVCVALLLHTLCMPVLCSPTTRLMSILRAQSRGHNSELVVCAVWAALSRPLHTDLRDQCAQWSSRCRRSLHRRVTPQASADVNVVLGAQCGVAAASCHEAPASPAVALIRRFAFRARRPPAPTPAGQRHKQKQQQNIR